MHFLTSSGFLTHVQASQHLITGTGTNLYRTYSAYNNCIWGHLQARGMNTTYLPHSIKQFVPLLKNMANNNAKNDITKQYYVFYLHYTILGPHRRPSDFLIMSRKLGFLVSNMVFISGNRKITLLYECTGKSCLKNTR